MIPNNNLSVLPWYTSIQQQNARKWWLYNRVYPLFTPAGFVLPSQLIVPHATNPSSSAIYLYEAQSGQMLENCTSKLMNTGWTRKAFASLGYDVIIYPGNLPAFNSMLNGRYYLSAVIDSITYYSEIFTVVNDIQPYLQIEWWDNSDFVMDGGTIVYKNPSFKNRLYLMSDIAKPEYDFEEEGESRDGYFYPIKQISKKTYRFSFFASEYLLDVMRFIRMSDFITIRKDGQIYSLDSFLITPEWEDNGDVASVNAEFTAATVGKKIGVGYVKSLRGDFNDDFNDDFNNN